MAATDAILLRAFTGIRNNVPPESLGNEDLAVGINIDLDNAGGPSRRTGYTLKLALAAPHSGFATKDEQLFLFMQGGTLRSLDPSLASATTVRAGLTADLPMAYWEHAGRVYFTNAAETGVVEAGAARTWGLVPPPTPAVAAGAGTLPAGRYLVSCTYVATDGQESGAPPSAVAVLDDAGGVAVALTASADPRVAAIVVYCSTADGGQLYEAGRYANADATALISLAQHDLQRPLQTQFMQPAPAGQLCAVYRGRMYVAVDNLLFASSAFGLELFDPVDFLAFTETITLLAPTVDGIYVGTGTETVWLGGDRLENFSQTSRQGFGAVPGTLAYYPLGRVAESQSEILAPMWLSTQGIVTGMPGGLLVNRSQNWDFTPPTRGAGLFRRQGALYQYLVTFSGA